MPTTPRSILADAIGDAGRRALIRFAALAAMLAVSGAAIYMPLNLAWDVGQVDWAQLLLVAIGLLVAGLIKGSTGLGYSTCALPFLVSAVGLKSAICIVTIPALA